MKVWQSELRHGSRFSRTARPRDIDAVLIATGPNWHATAAINAAKAGKDMYCEKPCTKNIAQSLTLADDDASYGPRIPGRHPAAEPAALRLCLRIGSNRQARQTQKVYAHPAGMPALTSGWLPQSPNRTKKSSTGICTWPAAWRPFNQKLLDGFNFEKGGRLVGGGVLEWGSHCVDLCQWAVGADHTAPSNTTRRRMATLVARYANGVELIFRETGWLPLGSCPVRFEGETGWVETGDSGKLVLSSPALIAGRTVAEIDGYPATFHVRDFLDCVKIAQPARRAMRRRLVMPTSLATRRTSRFFWVAPEVRSYETRVLGDEQANRLRSEALREPWRL